MPEKVYASIDVDRNNYEEVFKYVNTDKFIPREEVVQYDSMIIWTEIFTTDVVYIGLIKNYGHYSYITMIFKDCIPDEISILLDRKIDYIVESAVKPKGFECVHDNIYIKKIRNGFIYTSKENNFSAKVGCNYLDSIFSLVEFDDLTLLKKKVDFYIKAGIKNLILGFVNVNLSEMVEVIDQCKSLDILIVINCCKLQTKDPNFVPKKIEYVCKNDEVVHYELNVFQSKGHFMISPKSKYYKEYETDFFIALTSKNIAEYSNNPDISVINLDDWNF